MNLEDVFKWCVLSIIGIMTIIFAAWAACYSFDDCIKVGHSKTYCYLHLGK